MEVVLAILEYIAAGLFLVGVFGMYKAIEIGHPLFAILYLNLTVQLFVSVGNIVTYPFLATDVYLKLSTGANFSCFYFHNTCWLLTSVIRYIYILHMDWLDAHLPNVKLQSFLAISLALAIAAILIVPIFALAMTLGKSKANTVC